MSGIFGGTSYARRAPRKVIRRHRGHGIHGLGAISDAAAAQIADVMKDCANAKAAKAGYQAVAYGKPGPQTCWLANTIYSDGCTGKSQVVQYCVDNKIAGVAPSKVSATTLAVASTVATQAQAAIQAASVSNASQYPWGAYSAATLALQQKINAAGAAMVDKGTWTTYCRITEDGKLGAGTCGAGRAAGLTMPASCKEFATDCRGTKVGKSGAVAPTTTTYKQPVVTVTPEALPVLSEEESWLEKIGGLPTLIMGGAVAVAVGIVGFAIAKKKGLIGKKVKSNRRRSRARRNPATEMVPAWQLQRTEPTQGRPKGQALVGAALQAMKDEYRHEGMKAAEDSNRAGRGVSAKAREMAWRSVAVSIRTPSAKSRLASLKQAFEGGWNTRARALGYVANRRRRHRRAA